MEKLLSLDSNQAQANAEGGAQTFFFEEGDDDAPPMLTKLPLKVYFYAEDEELAQRMFPTAWFRSKETEFASKWIPEELPFHEVSALLIDMV